MDHLVGWCQWSPALFAEDLIIPIHSLGISCFDGSQDPTILVGNCCWFGSIWLNKSQGSRHLNP
eukprot:3378779-Prorocentrum_lima.AAC.1